MSTKRKAPSAPLSHYKDTFKLLSDRNEDGESVSSSIPEMSRLEEHQLKRSFQAIQTPETPSPPQEEDFSGRSNPLFQDENGTTFPAEKDDSESDEERFGRARKSGLVSSQQSSFTEVNPRNSMSPSINMEEQFESMTNPKYIEQWESLATTRESPVHIIPQVTRIRTPDVSPSFNMEEQLESMTNPKYTEQWESLATTRESPVHIVPQITRIRTPDVTASRGQLVLGNIGSDKPAINKPKLGYTMRDRIKDMQQNQETSFTTQPKKAKVTATEPSTSTSFMEPSTSTSFMRETTRDGIRSVITNGATPGPAPRYPSTEHVIPPRMEEDIEKDDDDEKRGPCLPRCAVVGVFLAILFGSIIALIVLVDENRKQEKKFGMVFPDPITYQECPNIKLNLTDQFRIECMFEFNHPQHRGIENVNSVIIHKPDGTNENGPIDFIGGNWTSENITPTCATVGTYRISFGSKHEFMLNVTLQEPTIDVGIEQIFFNDTSGSSQFLTHCTVYGDCTSYQANVVGITSSGEDTLTENKTCTIEQSNTAGISTQCNTTIPDSIAKMYTGLKCRVSAVGKIQREKNFNLPLCGLNCSTENVNCSEGAADRLKIDQCQLSTFFTKRCFKSGRMFHSYCDPKNNQCTCVLNWCEPGDPTALIGRDSHPGSQLCPEINPSNFTARPPTTPTTVTSATMMTTP